MHHYSFRCLFLGGSKYLASLLKCCLDYALILANQNDHFDSKQEFDKFNKRIKIGEQLVQQYNDNLRKRDQTIRDTGLNQA